MFFFRFGKKHLKNIAVAIGNSVETVILNRTASNFFYNNSFSVYYRDEELPEIKEWLRKNYNNGVKSISFLLHSDHGFDQAPLEAITKDRYKKMVRNPKPITSVEGICHNTEDEKYIGEGSAWEERV
jgi:hypothetical protein